MVKSKKSERTEIVLYGVASYPNLAKENRYGQYTLDLLLDKTDPQIGVLKKKINTVRVNTWGEDKEEWPEKATGSYISDGDERQDQLTYHGKMYITATSKQPVQCIDPTGKSFNPLMVKGGMFVKISIAITPWKNEKFGEGLSLYLQAVLVDTSKEKLSGFGGGGKSAKQLFGIDDSDDTDDTDNNEDNEEKSPPQTNKKKRSFMDEESSY